MHILSNLKWMIKSARPVRLGLLSLGVVAIGYVVYNPLYWPNNMLSWWLSKKVPPGSSVSVLFQEAQKHGWTIHQPQKITTTTITMLSIDTNECGTYIITNLGTSWFIFTYNNEAIWIFDYTEKLKSVVIKRGFDSF